MIRRYKNIISLLLLLVFLLPTIVKFEHYHNLGVPIPTYEKENHVFHNNCPICNFEFSVFLTSIEKIDFQKEEPSDTYFNTYNSRYNFNLSQYSFSLRAPPEKHI